MRAQTPLEACEQIAREHAAHTLAAINEQRAARLADRLEEYGTTLAKLAGAGGERSRGGEPAGSVEEQPRAA